MFHRPTFLEAKKILEVDVIGEEKLHCGDGEELGGVAH